MSTTAKKASSSSVRTGKKAAHEATPKVALPPEVTGEESVGRIRDILFGAQMRDYEKRFKAVESRLIKENEDLRKELEGRVTHLESFIKKELESLTERAKSEESMRSEAVENLQKELNGTRVAIDKRISGLDGQTGEAFREVRQAILDQSKELSTEMKRRSEQILERLEAEANELRFEKTDRAALSSMLMEVAMRLNEEFKLPDPD